MAKVKAESKKESPMWFKVLIVLIVILRVIDGFFYLLVGNLTGLLFFPSLIVYLALYYYMKSIRKTLTNWDYLLIVIVTGAVALLI
jgi:uncharacterized membrane protein